MEKDVLVREWCVERALCINPIDAKCAVDYARQIEAYILDRAPKVETSASIRYRCPHCRGDLVSTYIATGEELIAEISCPNCDK